MTFDDEEDLSVEEATKQYAEQLRSQREQKQRQRLADVAGRQREVRAVLDAAEVHVASQHAGVGPRVADP